MSIELAAVFFDDWSGLLRVVILGIAAYIALIAMLRASGKRALAKLNAFDLIVTIALGSVLATVLLSATVTLAEGLTAMAMLLGMQYAVAWASTRSRRVERLVASEPTLVYCNGLLHKAMGNNASQPMSCAKRPARRDTQTSKMWARSCSRATAASASSTERRPPTQLPGDAGRPG